MVFFFRRIENNRHAVVRFAGLFASAGERHWNAALPAVSRWALARDNSQTFRRREAGPLPIVGAQGA